MIALHGRHMKPTLRNISIDSRCDVHQTVLGIREGKEGWFDLYCPGGVACDDEGELYSIMVRTNWLAFSVLHYSNISALIVNNYCDILFRCVTWSSCSSVVKMITSYPAHSYLVHDQR